MKTWTQSVVATLVGCVVSLLVLAATMGAAFQTEDAVSKQIATESPYVKDQSLILYRLEQIEKKVDLLLQEKE
jgi:hypothetical protein